MDRIDEFYREIVSSQNSLYEGHWHTSDEAGELKDGLLQKVYGLASDNDNEKHSITNGKARVFLRRYVDKGLGLSHYFAVSDDSEEGPPPLIEPTDIEEDKKKKGKQDINVLTLEAILFDGDHRNNEINI